MNDIARTEHAGGRATLLLSGGHRCVCALDVNGVTLRALTAGLGKLAAHTEPLVLDTPEGGRIRVHARDVIAVMTGEHLLADVPPAAEHVPAAPNVRSNKDLPGSPFFAIDDFLSAAEAKHVLNFTLRERRKFVQATVTTAAADYRKAQVLHNLSELLPLIMPKLQNFVPTVWPLLKLAPTLVANFECQLTAHGHGDFFKIHNDNGSQETSRRIVSYVYYFNREPKGFSGGQLRIYDTLTQNYTYIRGSKFCDVEPRNNSLVIFPSYCHHEVLPIESASAAFEDRRFTVNGWFVRA